MAVILQVTGGPAIGRKTFLRAGQVLRVGRTEWAEFNIPQDGAMAPVHFSLEFDSHVCRIRDLHGGAGTLVNGQPMAEGVVGHGDRITAGATTFSVHIDGHAPVAHAPSMAAAAATAPVTATKSSGFLTVTTPLAAIVCGLYELDDELKPLLEPQHTVRQFYSVLTKGPKPLEAIRLLAHALPKRQAVWWACQCIRSTLGDKISPRDRAALGAAESWVERNSEDDRRSAQAAADATGYESGAGWAAGGAFWSGGSIAPPGLPEVPPKEALTAQAVVVAISLLANSDPKQTPRRFAEYLALGARVADGEERWPAK